ncbi:glycerophosphodiester phosphodiesterase family protein [Rhizobium sp. NFACC06-2]|uniref:glycerophosphodiester phosphodiesterase family protein n=1 Tax=Rhizobium sp. NFACC06-2 TaxID=1566264 RepID=UPI00165ED045|nr:glycerophosphodiester phosphodiesterase family protein [Rhizobium sp. NFACC06-2]
MNFDFLLNEEKYPRDGVRSILAADHRGGYSRCAHIPENSYEGARASKKEGIKFIEWDWQVTKDEELVAMHDKNLWRVMGLEGKVCDYTFEEINEITFQQRFLIQREMEKNGTVSNTSVKTHAALVNAKQLMEDPEFADMVHHADFRDDNLWAGIKFLSKAKAAGKDYYKRFPMKFYNFQYVDFAAVKAQAREHGVDDDFWTYMIFTPILHPDPTMARARDSSLQKIEQTDDDSGSEGNEQVFDTKATREEIAKFVHSCLQDCANIFGIELGVSGLGHFFDIETGETKDPRTGAIIRDRSVRALAHFEWNVIKLAPGFVKMRPDLSFGRCRRSYDYRIVSNGTCGTYDLSTGHSKHWPAVGDEKRIPFELRGLPVGYPVYKGFPCDVVNADDVVTDVAFMAWCEHENIDYASITKIPRNQWLLKFSDEARAAIGDIDHLYPANDIL